MERHAQNIEGRGDLDSVKRRQRSVEDIGIRQELRAPPWVTQHATLGVDDRFCALHWGTLFEGAKRAWQHDTEKKNKVVQQTIATPIKSAKLYRRDLPVDAAAFLVEYGNRLNEEATATTILQVFVLNFLKTKRKDIKQYIQIAHANFDILMLPKNFPKTYFRHGDQLRW